MKAHLSDCAIHNSPAYKPGPCTCGVAEVNVFPAELLDANIQGQWRVEIIDVDGDGGIDVIIFSGPFAKGRAGAYADAVCRTPEIMVALGSN